MKRIENVQSDLDNAQKDIDSAQDTLKEMADEFTDENEGETELHKLCHDLENDERGDK